jgi:copper chaperone CopZ
MANSNLNCGYRNYTQVSTMPGETNVDIKVTSETADLDVQTQEDTVHIEEDDYESESEDDENDATIGDGS